MLRHDFFGQQAHNSWFSQGMLKPSRPPSSVLLPSRSDVGHQFAHLPDVACAMRRRLEVRDRLPAFSHFSMAGRSLECRWSHAGPNRASRLRRGFAAPQFKVFPWWLIWLAASFVTTLCKPFELRYLRQTEINLTNAVLGEEPHTPLDEAIEATRTGMGCPPLSWRLAIWRSLCQHRAHLELKHQGLPDWRWQALPRSRQNRDCP